MVEICGTVAPGFEGVKEAFIKNFSPEEGRATDKGAAVCIMKDGEVVVNLAGGEAKEGVAYTPETLQLVFSNTKGAAAICALKLVQEGKLDLDVPVATYWPEFAANGKEAVTTRQILSHRSGLNMVDGPPPLDEVLKITPIEEALANQKPHWEPGTAHGYHALTYGWLIGRIIREITGKSIGQYFADEVAAPLELDFWIGLPESQEPRVSPISNAPQSDDPEIAAIMADQTHPFLRSLLLDGVFFAFEDNVFNERRVHASEIAAANGITTAHSMAKLYSAVFQPIDGFQILNSDTINQGRTEHSSGPDGSLILETRFGLGFMLNCTTIPLLSDNSFGHCGAGGSLAFADPEAGISFAYVMNQMGNEVLVGPRASSLVTALREAL